MLKVTVNLKINDNIYQRNPQDTDLGKRIIQHSVSLIDEVGFDSFTFKKLAKEIKSTEASVYRYFENKHLLFVYLVNWYWEWMNFRVGFHTMNISDPTKRLKAAIAAIVDTSSRSASIDFMDTEQLHRVVVTEGTKAYHKKTVDEENKEGFFLSYKALCRKIADILLEIKPGYPYPRALASTLLEAANNNIYFAQHLPRLTDIQHDEQLLDAVADMLLSFALGSLEGPLTPGDRK